MKWSVSASIGVALGDDSDDTAEELVRNADIAMYRAKARGKAGFVVFRRGDAPKLARPPARGIPRRQSA